jgi:hypothetical protein
LYKRLSAAGALLALSLAACGGSNGSLPFISQNSGTQKPAATDAVQALAAGANVVANPGFETGALSPWTQCGSTSGASVTASKAHSGSYGALIGTTVKPEVNGTAGICQTVTVPAGGQLSFYVYEGTNDTISYADQEADVLSTSGTKLTQLYKEAASTNGWEQKTFSLSAYAGQTVQLYFGVKGNGWSSGYVYMYLDDVSLAGSGSTATPVPSTSPTPTPKPSTSPTPSAAPSAAPCNNAQFLTYQSEFGNGSISADQLVDICGTVTQVLPSKVTSSGNHGYFYVQVASGDTIEIVSNLDAMAEASTDAPPSTWPWVSVGQYVYVQGRYYYDSSSSQGIDWTEDDTGSWPYVGWVYVCNSSGGSCQKYW